jgi:hypothetical protein
MFVLYSSLMQLSLLFALLLVSNNEMDTEEVTREYPQLSNPFLLVTIAIRSVLVTSEKVCFGVIFRPSLAELCTFYSIFIIWVNDFLRP